LFNIQSYNSNGVINRIDKIGKTLERTVEKLSSGSRVVSARNDVAALVVSSRLTAETAALHQVHHNTQQAASMLQIAEGAMQRSQDMLIRMKALAVQASSGNLSDMERELLDVEFRALMEEMVRVSEDTSFGTLKIFNNGDTPAITRMPDVTAPTSNLSDVSIADFDNDGNRDLFYASETGVYITTGNGDGTYGTTLTVATGLNFADPNLETGDFNGDGYEDVVIISANAADDDILFINNGNDTYTQTLLPANYGGTGSFAMTDYATTGDFNGDSITDLVVRTSNNTVGVFAGLALGGGFQQIFEADISPDVLRSINSADFNNDGHLDFTIFNNSANEMATYFGDGQGGFSVGPITNNPSQARRSDTADFNLDGTLDIVNARMSQDITVQLSDGAGSFPGSLTVAGSFQTVATTDWNVDGLPDVIGMNQATGVISIFANNGNDTFTEILTADASGLGGMLERFSLGDLNGDGLEDLVVTSNSDNDILTFINDTSLGRTLDVRVSTSANPNLNLSVQINSIHPSALDNILGWQKINTVGGSQRAMESIDRGLEQMIKNRSIVGAQINRIVATSDNQAVNLENKEAANSAYRDTNVAEEMTTFVSQQTMLQAGVNIFGNIEDSKQLIISLYNDSFGQ